MNQKISENNKINLFFKIEFNVPEKDIASKRFKNKENILKKTSI